MNALTRSMIRLAVRPTTTLTKSSSPRTFTTLSPLRPTLTRTSFRPTSITPTPMNGTLDIVPSEAISRHPALQDPASAIRCGPRNTMVRATRLKQKRRLGFLARMRSRTGRKILLRRRIKGRSQIAQ